MDQHITSQDGAAAAALAALQESLRDCRACGLCAGRTQVVFGGGDPDASLMFVGEAPGFHEDRQGIPFVGQAGKLLDSLLEQIGLSRGDVYIGNVLKCRPPENRDPTPAEIEACSPHLMEQIAIIRPRVICTLGRFATKLLTDTELSMTAVHGKAKQVTLGGVDLLVFPVFHPAAALYTPANRTLLEEDFAKLRVLLTRGLSPASEGAVPEAAPRGHESTTQGHEEATQGAEVTDPTETSSVTPAKTSQPPVSGRSEQLPLW